MKFNSSLVFLSLLTISSNTYAASYRHGEVSMVATVSSFFLVRWDGENTENCTENAVRIMPANFPGAQYDQAFSIAIAAATSGKPIRIQLDGCTGSHQIAKSVQLCTFSDCSY